MKKTLFIILALLALCGSGTVLAQEVRGEDGKWTFIARLQNPTDTLYIVPLQNIRSMRPIVKSDGEFRLTTALSRVGAYYIISPSLLRRDADADTTGVAFLITAVPGEVMVVEGRYDENQPSEGLAISGTPFYQQYRDAWAARAQMLSADSVEVGIDFIRAHPDNEAATVLITAIGFDYPDRTNEAVSLFSPAVRQGRMKDFITQSVAEVRAYHHQDDGLPEGTPAPPFTLRDINGRPLALSSLRGKYVILDFWGSWCGWCIRGIPRMKEYYAKYAGRFEIIGIDCNETEDKWRAAVRTHDLPWLHVYCPRGARVLTDYLIEGFPTKVIINPDCNIVRTVTGEDPVFYDFLDRLFAE